MMMPTNEESQFCLMKKAESALVEYNENIINSWLARANQQSAKIRRTGPEYAEIAVSAGSKTRIFGLCFGKTYRSRRKFRINPLCLDTFGLDDECEMEKIKLIWFFAEHIDDITKDLIVARKAKRLYGAWSRAWNAMYGNKK